LLQLPTPPNPLPADQIHPKVTAAALGAALATLIIWVFNIPATPAEAGALSTILAFVCGYITPSA
jgi:hypothetical protein